MDVSKIVGPVVAAHLSDSLVLYGLALLDVIDETSHSTEIDLYARQDDCTLLLADLTTEGYEWSSLNESCYLASKPGERDISIRVTSEPMDKAVGKAEICRFHVYYDGHTLVKLRTWNADKTLTPVVHDVDDLCDAFKNMLRTYKTEMGYDFVDRDGCRITL